MRLLYPKPLLSFGVLNSMKAAMYHNGCVGSGGSMVLFETSRPLEETAAVAMAVAAATGPQVAKLTRDDSSSGGGGGDCISSPLTTRFPDPILLSTPSKCTVTADDNGAFGQPQVVLLDDGEDDKNRWAVHGGKWSRKTIEKPHWIQLDWDVPIFITRVLLDWETAYAENYELQIQVSSSTTSSPDDNWKTVIKAPILNMETRQWGRSRDVDGPKHRLHELDVPFSSWTKSLRLWIHESAMQNGYLSLWNIKVLGYEATMVPPGLLDSKPVLLTKPHSDFVTVTCNAVGESPRGVQNILNDDCADDVDDTDTDANRWLVLPGNLFILPGDICGGVWLQLDFQQSVFMTKVVLDWCGECSHNYALQVLLPAGLSTGSSDQHAWQTVFRNPYQKLATTEEPDVWGQAARSGGTGRPVRDAASAAGRASDIHDVKYPLQVASTDDWQEILCSPPDPNQIEMEQPEQWASSLPVLSHDVHNINLPWTHQPATALRLWLPNPLDHEIALWQVKVYGFKL